MLLWFQLGTKEGYLVKQGAIVKVRAGPPDPERSSDPLGDCWCFFSPELETEMVHALQTRAEILQRQDGESVWGSHQQSTVFTHVPHVSTVPPTLLKPLRDDCLLSFILLLF